MVESLLLFISYFTQLLAIMNPFSVIPTFLSLTHGMNTKDVRDIVRKAMYTGLMLVIVFTLIGKYILEAFHVSLAGLRVGGGIILMTIAIDMLGDEVRTKRMPSKDIAVVPIATPLIIGPGTMTTILLLTSQNPHPWNIALLLAAGILACVLSFMILSISEVLVKVISISTLRAIGRFMALIIAGIAAEMIANGIYQYYSMFTSGG